MDIGNTVNYEVDIPVGIHFPPGTPKAGEKTGIVWWVKHAECDAVEALASRHAREVQLEQLAAKGGFVDSGGAAIRREREKVAASVSRWDWGEWTFEGGEVPECNFEGVMEVLTKQKWFYSDPYKGINDAANFTNASGDNSAKPLRPKSGTTQKTTKVKLAAKETPE